MWTEESAQRVANAPVTTSAKPIAGSDPQSLVRNTGSVGLNTVHVDCKVNHCEVFIFIVDHHGIKALIPNQLECVSRFRRGNNVMTSLGESLFC